MRQLHESAVVLFCLCRYEFQCQYGSIGWAVGATLGYSVRCCPFLVHAHLVEAYRAICTCDKFVQLMRRVTLS
jgi:TPP-dependent 2-oxoacid decarboxylase